MARKNLVRFNVGGKDPLNLFKVKVSGSFTVPDSKSVASAVDAGVGGANLASVVAVGGGQLLVATNDGTDGTANVFDLTMQDVCDLFPLDVVALSAVGVPAANQVKVTVTSTDGTVRQYIITGVTTTAVVVGYYA